MNASCKMPDINKMNQYIYYPPPPSRALIRLEKEPKSASTVVSGG